MTGLLLLAAVLPGLVWEGPADGEAAKHGIERVVAAAPAGAQRAMVPGVRPRVGVASATGLAWIDANGWRFERRRDATFSYTLPAGKVPLAMAEAFAWDADAVMKIEPEDLPVFGKMLKLLRAASSVNLPPVADIGIVDDGTAIGGEAMNMMARMNLLFRVIPKPAGQHPVELRLGGEKGAPKNPAAYPDFARQRLGDEKRSLRIYGTSLILGRLCADASRGRVHLLNYGQRPVDAVRIRVRGAWQRPEIRMVNHDGDAVAAKLEDIEVVDGFTEFTIQEFAVYAIVDLAK